MFGGLFALLYLPMGYSYALSYWINGLVFDIVHAVSNFIVGLWAFRPILNGFDRAMNIIYGKGYFDKEIQREKVSNE